MNKLKIWIMPVLATLFWAGNFVFGKFVVAEMTPVWITFSRWIVASVLLFVTANFTEKPDWKKAMLEWPTLLAMGFLGLACYNLVLYSSLDYTSPTNASLINSLNPGLIVLFSVFFLKEKISLAQVLGIITSIIGVMLILTDGKLELIFQMEYNKGDLLMLLAILVWTIYSILAKRIKSVPPITATAISALFAVIMLAPFALYQGIDTIRFSPLALTGIIYISVFASLLSFIFWNMSIRKIGPSKTGIFANLIPVFTAIISWILGANITWTQTYGAIVVFIGVFLTTGVLDKRPAAIKEKY